MSSLSGRPDVRPGTIRVLHVERDPAFAERIVIALEREDDRLTVQTAIGAGEGLEHIADREVDCVVSGYDLSESNGIEFLEAVREEHPDLPFVLFTAEGSEEIASDAISAGVTEYVRRDRGTDRHALLASKIAHAVERTNARRVHEGLMEALETAQEGIGIVDDGGRFVYANGEYASLYGYDSDEMVGERWESVHECDDVGAEEHGVWSGEVEGLRADGTAFVADRTVTASERGGLVYTVRDATEQRRRERELRLKDQAMDEAPAGIVITDPGREDNPIVYANEWFTQLTGYDRSEILGRNCRFLQGEDTDETVVAAIREAIADETPVTAEIRNYREDGTPFWNEVRIRPLRNDGGVTHFVGFQQDVTERIERNRRLERTTARLGALFEDSPDMISIHDEEGTILDVNRRFREVVVRSDDEVVGEKVWKIDQTSDPDELRATWDGMDVGDRIRVETTYRRGDDSTFPVEVHVVRLDIAGDDRFMAISRDVTDRKRRERELRRQNERLEEFASVASHDLRNPLTVASGWLELAREDCDDSRLEEVARAHERMETLIEDLLWLAREGQSVSEIETVDMAETVGGCWQDVETTNARLVADIDRTIRADRTRLEQLLGNLMRNAIEHGGETVTITVDELDDGFVLEDDGPGIPPEERTAVFDASYSTSQEGGLGLSIVKQVADAHDWSVGIAEGTEGGARFEITGVEFADE